MTRAGLLPGLLTEHLGLAEVVRDAGYSKGHFSPQAVCVGEVHRGEESRLAEKVGRSIGHLDFKLAQTSIRLMLITLRKPVLR
jgi:hypothetical protein